MIKETYICDACGSEYNHKASANEGVFRMDISVVGNHYNMMYGTEQIECSLNLCPQCTRKMLDAVGMCDNNGTITPIKK